MVKQFTIPCQFGQETSPVTLYIGHPEPTHHPIKFQSDWLASAKNGTIPQDLMDTLQKLHDLAQENGADFEELCYYALISATQHSSGGVSPDDINKYADEFVKKEGNVETTNTENSGKNEQNDSTNSSDNNEKPKTTDSMKEAEKIIPDTANDTQETVDKTIEELGNIQQETADTAERIQPTFGDIAKKKDDYDDSSSSGETNNETNSNNDNNTDSSGSGGSTLTESYSQEDEDLLLDDDLSSF